MVKVKSFWSQCDTMSHCNTFRWQFIFCYHIIIINNIADTVKITTTRITRTHMFNNRSNNINNFMDNNNIKKQQQ